MKHFSYHTNINNNNNKTNNINQNIIILHKWNENEIQYRNIQTANRRTIITINKQGKLKNNKAILRNI